MCFETTSTENKNSFSATNIDPALNDASKANYQQSANYLSSNPYRTYTGPTEAAFGSTFGTAKSAATNQLAGGNAAFDQGTTALGTGLDLAARTASTPISALMSDYTDAALAPTIQAIQRQAAAANAGLAQGATMAGAFGDTGYGAAKALQNRDTTQQIADATGSAYDRAYNTALSTHQAGLGQLLSGVGAASSIGSSSGNQMINLEALLGSFGQNEQTAGQTGINTAINVNQQNQLGQLQQNALQSSILSASPHNTSTYGNSNTTTTQPDNTGMGLLGTAISSLSKPGSLASLMALL